MNETWTFEELEHAQRLMGRQRFSQQELDEIFNLYNRINKTTKRATSCGKCVVNVLQNLERHYGRIKQTRTN